jgi:hypothetical protein
MFPVSEQLYNRSYLAELIDAKPDLSSQLSLKIQRYFAALFLHNE